MDAVWARLRISAVTLGFGTAAGVCLAGVALLGGGGANMRDELEKGARRILGVSWLWHRLHIEDMMGFDMDTNL